MPATDALTVAKAQDCPGTHPKKRKLGHSQRGPFGGPSAGQVCANSQAKIGSVFAMSDKSGVSTLNIDEVDYKSSTVQSITLKSTLLTICERKSNSVTNRISFG